MSATEHILVDLQRRIEATLEAVRREYPAPHGSQSPRSSPGTRSAVDSLQLPRLQPPASRPGPGELAQRDLQIAKELLHLQRTLSRQTFRGAESARRLVRRLIRRAELNAREIEALTAALPGATEHKQRDADPLPALLERLSEQLTELKGQGRALGAFPTGTDRPSSDTIR